MSVPADPILYGLVGYLLIRQADAQERGARKWVVGFVGVVTWLAGMLAAFAS